MQTKLNKITVQIYLDFAQLLKSYRGIHKENRVFALKHEKEFQTPTSLLFQWLKVHSFRVIDPLVSTRFTSYSSSVNNFIGLFSIFFGLFVGIGLLSYSGKEPINIIYYLFFVMFLPLGSMLLALFSMISRKNIFNFFTLLFPLHWFEQIFNRFSFKDKIDFVEQHFSFSLQKWMFIHRLQLFSLLFSLGVFLALIFMVVTQDIAFAWSTTLNVDAVGFQSFLDTIATPWKSFLPSLVPSVELVEISQHYRLGERLDSTLTEHANRLGEWWKFLAMTTFFYVVILRFFLWLFSQYKIAKTLEKEFFEIEGIQKLLREFKTPFVSTKSPKLEKYLEIKEENKTHVKQVLKRSETVDLKSEKVEEPLGIIEDVEYIESQYHNIIGWNFSFDEMILVNDSKHIIAKNISSVGGRHTFLEDEKVALEAKESVLLYVKSWEPPTMDFVDFLEELIENRAIDDIQIFPLGIVDNDYKGTSKEFSIWNRKIEGLKSKKVWIIDEQ